MHLSAKVRWIFDLQVWLPVTEWCCNSANSVLYFGALSSWMHNLQPNYDHQLTLMESELQAPTPLNVFKPVTLHRISSMLCIRTSELKLQFYEWNSFCIQLQSEISFPQTTFLSNLEHRKLNKIGNVECFYFGKAFL